MGRNQERTTTQETSLKELAFLHEKDVSAKETHGVLLRFMTEADEALVVQSKRETITEPPLHERFILMGIEAKKEALLSLTGEEVAALIVDMKEATGDKDAFLNAMQPLKMLDQISPDRIKAMVSEQVANIDSESPLLKAAEKEPDYDCELVVTVDYLNDYGKTILDQKQQIAMEYVVSTMINESTLWPYNVGVDSDCGLGQSTPFWFTGKNNSGIPAWNPFRPEEAISGMIGLFEYAFEKNYVNTWDEAMTWYNAGGNDLRQAKAKAAKNGVQNWKQYLEKDVAKIYTSCVQKRRSEVFSM